MPNFVMVYNTPTEKVMTSTEKFWKRVADLTRAFALAQDLGFKRMWSDKLFELMKKQDQYESRTIN